jgi:hypothetical protein
LIGAQTSGSFLYNPEIEIVADRCTPLVDTIEGPAEIKCRVDPDNVPPTFVVAYVNCPAGQIALQNGCVSTGPEAITGVTQQLELVETVQCIVNLPAAGPYVVSVTATCVEMSITAPDGKALKARNVTPEATFARMVAAARAALP